jgi:hypothetical protein
MKIKKLKIFVIVMIVTIYNNYNHTYHLLTQIMKMLSEEEMNYMTSDDFFKKLVIYTGKCTSENCNNSTDTLYLYDGNIEGDYDCEKKQLSSCNNAYCIPTKKNNKNYDSSYYTDDEYEKNITIIINSLANMLKIAKKYDFIAFPLSGFGVASELHIKAPKTLSFIETLINESIGIDYEEIRIHGGCSMQCN